MYIIILKLFIFAILYNIKIICTDNDRSKFSCTVCCRTCCDTLCMPKYSIEEDYKNITDKLKKTGNDEIAKQYDNISRDKTDLIDKPGYTANSETINWNNILINTIRYLYPFYNHFIDKAVAEEQENEYIKSGHEIFLNKIKEDLDKISPYKIDTIPDNLVFEFPLKFVRSFFSTFKKYILNSSSTYAKLKDILKYKFSIEGQINYDDFADIYTYFEDKSISKDPNVAKCRKKGYKVLYYSENPSVQDFFKDFDKLDDDTFKDIEFVFLFYYKTLQFYILIEDTEYTEIQKKIAELNKPKH